MRTRTPRRRTALMRTWSPDEWAAKQQFRRGLPRRRNTYRATGPRLSNMDDFIINEKGELILKEDAK